MKKTFAFIGTGNMAFAIIGGLTNENSVLAVPKENIILFDTNVNQYEKFGDGFSIADSIVNAVGKADIIVLAVKPQNYPDVLAEINGTNLSGKVIISIAAGISTDYICSKVGECAVVRAMPNTPLLVGKGVTQADCPIFGHNYDFAHHLVGILQRNSCHEGSIHGHHIVLSALYQGNNAIIVLSLAPLIPGADLVVAIVVHNFRILRCNIAENQTVGFHKNHILFSLSTTETLSIPPKILGNLLPTSRM